jgi:O-methyltransferase involved in polyketide biosynthesis
MENEQGSQLEAKSFFVSRKCTMIAEGVSIYDLTLT